MREQEIIESLTALGLSRGEYAYVQLLPLVQVAWAEGQVEAGERKAIIDYLRAIGLAQSGGPHLERWLSSPLTEKAYASAQRLLVNLAYRYEGVDPQLNLSTLPRVLEGCNSVAHASGGFLGMGRASAVEKRVIDDIKEAFQIYEAEALASPHNRGGVGWATLTGEMELDEANAAAPEPPPPPAPEPPPPAPEPEPEPEPEPAPEPEPEPAPVRVRPSASQIAAWERLILLRRHRSEHAELLPDSPALSALDGLISEAEDAIGG